MIVLHLNNPTRTFDFFILYEIRYYMYTYCVMYTKYSHTLNIRFETLFQNQKVLNNSETERDLICTSTISQPKKS